MHEIVAIVISYLSVAEGMESDDGESEAEIGLKDEPLRKEWFALICMTVVDFWWKMQLKNGQRPFS